MATRGFSYDAPAYQVPYVTTADILATTADVKGRFAAFTTMVAKAAFISVVVAGTGASNCNLVFQKRSATGTALTTFADINLTTNAIGYTTNILLTGTLSQNDVFSIVKGADAVGAFAIGVEWNLQNGATVTS